MGRPRGHRIYCQKSAGWAWLALPTPSETREFSVREDTPLTQARALLSDLASPLLILSLRVIVVAGVEARSHRCLPLSPHPRAEQVGSGGGRNESGVKVGQKKVAFICSRTHRTSSNPQCHLPSLTPEPPGCSRSARRKRREAGGCARCRPASAAGWACAAPRRCSAAPPQ